MLRFNPHNTIMVEGERHAISQIAKSRLSLCALCFITAYAVLMARMVDLSIVQGTIPHLKAASQHASGAPQAPIIMPRRGNIYDANGFLLATTLKTPSLYVDPKLVIDAKTLTRDVLKILPDINEQALYNKLTAKNRFNWLAHALTPAQQEQILHLGQPALGFQGQHTRIYPQQALLAHLVGYTDRDGRGLSGIERAYDDVLGRGDDVKLTVDLRLQHIVKREIAKAMDTFQAKAGAGIIMDTKTGAILAGVSLPDFDLNAYQRASAQEKFNRFSLGVYELGSIFKIFSTAAALEINKTPMNAEYDARKPLRVGWHRIRDYHPQKRMLNVPEIFVHSSNIGSALMAREIGTQALKGFYKDLGLLERMRLDIKEVGAPLSPAKWREGTTLTASFGHGLATTPLQMTAAVATALNGGYALTPHIAQRETQNLQLRVMSEGTSHKMRQLLRLAVTAGTGKNADLLGTEIGGKTGTAEKIVGGKYHSDRLISSFVGAFPMHNPRYTVMVMIDEPQGHAGSYGYATGGWVAAPAVKNIAHAITAVLGLSFDDYARENDISRDLMPYIRDKKSQKYLAAYTRDN